MKILILDNTLDPSSWGAAEITRHCREQAPGSTITVRRPPQGDLPKSLASYDRVILTGSRMSALKQEPWTRALDALIRERVQSRMPLLALCYGLQALARAIAGPESLRASPTPEIGWTEIERLQEAPLFKNLDRKFTAFSSHIEEAFELPSNFHILARSKRCEIQAFQIEKLPIYGLQFHPEKDPTDANRSIQTRVKQLGSRSKKWVAHTRGQTSRELGAKIFKNFLNT